METSIQGLAPCTKKGFSLCLYLSYVFPPPYRRFFLMENKFRIGGRCDQASDDVAGIGMTAATTVAVEWR